MRPGNICKQALGRAYFACALMALSFAIAGCSTTSGIETVGKTTWTDEGSRDLAKKVDFNNRSLAGDIEIVDIKSDRVGDLMRTQAVLRSKDRDTVKAQYRYEWFDITGMEINANAAWKPFILYGRETRTLQGVAPDARAKEFKLKIRELDE